MQGGMVEGDQVNECLGESSDIEGRGNGLGQVEGYPDGSTDLQTERFRDNRVRSPGTNFYVRGDG